MLFFNNHNLDFFFVNLKIMLIQAKSRPISKLITSLVLVLVLVLLLLLLLLFKKKPK